MPEECACAICHLQASRRGFQLKSSLTLCGVKIFATLSLVCFFRLLAFLSPKRFVSAVDCLTKKKKVKKQKKMKKQKKTILYLSKLYCFCVTKQAWSFV